MAEIIDPQILLIDKPVGPTSHDVVNLVRFELRQNNYSSQNIRVGHAGTVDFTGFSYILISNKATFKKTVNAFWGNNTYSGYSSGEWNETSNNISRITFVDESSGNFLTGSVVKVYGVA